MEALVELCKKIVGDKYTSDEEHIRWIYSRCDTGPWRERMPEVVVRPGDTEDVSEIVKIANRFKAPIWPQGGGTLPSGGGALTPQGIVMDLTRLAEIDIREDDRIVVTGAGATWGALIHELWKRNLDTFRGPGSGKSATVGGSVSMASNWHASARYGGCGDVAVGLEVVLGTGEVLKTSSASKWPHEFFARYGGGPDITGLFIGDQGTMGIKTKVALSLAEKTQSVDGISWMNSEPKDLENTIRKIAGLELATDLVFHDDGIFRTYEYYKDTVGFNGVGPEMRRLMTAYFKDLEESKVDTGKAATLAFAIVESHENESVDTKMNMVRQIIKENNGWIIGRNYAMDYYTNQLHAFYQPWRNVDIGRGTNWVGLGGLIRLSEFAKARKLYHDYLAENKEDLDKYGMFGGYMGYLHKTSSFALYPCFFCDQWEVTTRKRMIYHSRRLRDLFLSSTTGWYPYFLGEFGSEGMVKAWSGPHYLVLKQLKQVFDPNRIINPGMLGL